MEKLITSIPQFRIDEQTKGILQDFADKDKRKLTELIRIILQDIAEKGVYVRYHPDRKKRVFPGC